MTYNVAISKNQFSF